MAGHPGELPVQQVGRTRTREERPAEAGRSRVGVSKCDPIPRVWDAKVVLLVPGEGTAQVCDRVEVKHTPAGYEVQLWNANGTWRVLDSSWRSGVNAFPTYAGAARYANQFVTDNGRRVRPVTP